MASLKAQRNCSTRTKRKRPVLVNWPCLCTALEMTNDNPDDCDSFCSYSMSTCSHSSKGSTSSSISLSGFSSSDTVEDSISSSGCSFDMMQRTSRRKEKVKGYLKELKTMVNLNQPKGRRPDTLSTLEQVVNSMRRIQAKQHESDTESRSRISREDQDSGFHSSYHPQAEEIATSSTNEEALMFVLSPWAGIIETISQNVKNMIGYPPDLMLGRPLSEFIKKQEQAMLNNIISLDVDEIDKWENVSADTCTKSADDRKKSTFISIRAYKGLDQGYSLGAVDKYMPLEVKISVKCLREGENPGTACMKSVPAHTNIQPGMVSHGKRSCIVLRCHPLKTVYRGPQCTPESRTFSTRHSVDFIYRAMHRNAICLLGYLPQEFMGSSVFDYYHSEDLTELYHTYQAVVSSEEKPYKSRPYRLRVKNGDYILVETEWSLVQNRWSRDIEFVIGQHTVIRGPNNPNVFESSSSHSDLELNSVKRFTMQEKIRKLLTKSSDVNSGENLFTVPKTTYKKIQKQEKKLEKLPTEVSDISERGAMSPTVSVALSPPHDVYDGGLSVTYEHLNYKTSIRRFLLSQPKTYSSEESEKKSEWLDEEDAEDEFIKATLVDFAIPKPPSFGSSTKVLVSEQEPREEIREDAAITSPIREEPVEEESPVTNDKETPVSETETPKAYLPVTLTQEMLRAHTKMQEKLYVQQEIHLSPTFGTKCSKGQHCLKRQHSPQCDPEMDRPYLAKTLHTDIIDKQPSDILKPTFPLAPMDTSGTNSERLRMFPCWSTYTPPTTLPTSSYGRKNTLSMNLQQLQGNSLGLCSQGFPLMQINQSVPETTSSSHNSMQWSYYPTTGNAAAAAYPFYPLYTPMSLFKTCNSPVFAQASTDPCLNRPKYLSSQRRIPVTGSSSSLSSQPKYQRKKPMSMRKNHGTQANQKKGNVWSESSDNLSSHDDTTSSLLYLLESDSHNCSSSPEEMDQSLVKGQHRLTDIPPWLQGPKWTEETKMRYTLPKRNIARILKEDREKLASLPFSNKAYEQLQELIEDVSKENSPPAIDEDADELIFWNVADDETQSDVKEGFSLITLDDAGMCGKDQDHNHGLKSFFQSKKGKSKQETRKGMMEESGDSDTTLLMKDDEKQQDSSTSGNESGNPGKMSDTVDVDSTTSKESSNLTPSDQCSNEEAPSSLKESDNMSKEESDTSSRDQKDCETYKESMNYPKLNFLDKIFTPLKLEVPQICPFSKMSKLPNWVMHTTFNENIKKKYQMKVELPDKVLGSDWKRSLEMKQTAKIQLQLSLCQSEILEESSSGPRWSAQPSTSTLGDNKETNSTSCETELRNVIITELMEAMLNPNQTSEYIVQQNEVKQNPCKSNAGPSNVLQHSSSDTREGKVHESMEESEEVKNIEDFPFEHLFRPVSDDSLLSDNLDD